jgi:hypothetical protein
MPARIAERVVRRRAAAGTSQVLPKPTIVCLHTDSAFHGVPGLWQTRAGGLVNSRSEL